MHRSQQTVSNWLRTGLPADPTLLAAVSASLKPIPDVIERLAALAASGLVTDDERERERLQREYERVGVRLRATFGGANGEIAVTRRVQNFKK
jgi:hypothetical protein